MNYPLSPAVMIIILTRAERSKKRYHVNLQKENILDILSHFITGK
jgi:hypothetical protein